MQDPLVISYLMGPLALVAILVLRHSSWSPASRCGCGSRSSWPSRRCRCPGGRLPQGPSSFTRARPGGWHATAVTTVIYLSGWGPAMVGAFTFVALENVSHDGSRMWRVTSFWSILGIAVGQFGIRFGWIPSFMSQSRSAALGIMGTFVLFFIIRMAGATSEQTERVEASMRTSEDRFRSLVQNSTDATLVMGAQRHDHVRQPGHCRACSGGLLKKSSAIPPVSSSIPRSAPNSRAARCHRAVRHEGHRSRPVPDEARQRHMALRRGRAERPKERASVGGYVGNVRDVTERKEAEFLLAHQALHDPLTGLPNRMLLVDRLRQAIARSRPSREPAPVVMFLDLDRFKLVNDSLGHGAGDELLVRVADRLARCCGRRDTLCRFGGDEFVMLCEGIVDEDSVLVLAERTMEMFDLPFTLKGEQFHIGVSIGVAFVDDDVRQSRGVARATPTSPCTWPRPEAGTAKSSCSTRRRGRWPANAFTPKPLWPRPGARRAVVYYQPIIDVASGAPSAWRRCCGGSTRRVASCCRRRSSKWPNRPG